MYLIRVGINVETGKTCAMRDTFFELPCCEKKKKVIVTTFL